MIHLLENIDLSSFKVDVELIGNNENNVIEGGLGNDIVDGKMVSIHLYKLVIALGSLL